MKWKVMKIRAGDKRIAIADDGGSYVCEVDYDDVDHEQAELDAKLIAAAPQMLEELITIYEGEFGLNPRDAERIGRLIKSAGGLL